MADFAQDIQNFQQNGDYTYKFDNVGNLTFNSSSEDFSQVYLSFPLYNITYDNSKINSFYTASFEEFVIQPTVEITSSVDILTQQLNTLQVENTTLKQHLDGLISQSETNSSISGDAAIKQVIIGLRIALGQGRMEANFSPNFPYAPLKAPVTSSP